jgi:regulator of sigma E protease
MTTILATIFVLGVLIFIHELGHFLIAKWARIRVEKFSLGFPPFVITRRVGETQYCLGAIPLGGFVKMAGENPDEETTGEPYEFMSKRVHVRAAVIAAGPVMNFILAWLILWGILFFRGEAITEPDPPRIGIVSPGSPAEKAGLQIDDLITSINSVPVTSFTEMALLISQQVEKPITVTWIRNGQEMSATVTTAADRIYNEKGEKIPVGKLGVAREYSFRRLGFFEAAGRGFLEVIGFVKLLVKFVYDLIAMNVSAKMIGGPVFIAQVAGEMAELGFSALLRFMAFLSVNLAVLNVLPIPVLDGGHLVFLLIERIKGSPLTVNQRMVAQQIGLVFLLLVIVLVTYNDIVRFITG